MILKKDLEIIMSTPEVWRALHELEKLYSQRLNGEEENKKYRYHCKLFREMVEDERGVVIPF